MMKLLSSLLALVIAGSAFIARGQETRKDSLTDRDKVDLIVSVLEQELRNQSSIELELGTQSSVPHRTPFVITSSPTAPHFGSFRKVSSENVEFIEPSMLSKHGFELVDAEQLKRIAQNVFGGAQYLVFRSILWRDGTAFVELLRVSEGQTCFSGYRVYRHSYTYEARRTASGWVSQLVKGPQPIFLAPKSLTYTGTSQADNPMRGFIKLTTNNLTIRQAVRPFELTLHEPPTPCEQIQATHTHRLTLCGPGVTLVTTATSDGSQMSVTVQLLIDERGNVITAQAISGDPRLREVAVSDAKQRKYAQKVLSGVPVKVNGIIVYNFKKP